MKTYCQQIEFPPPPKHKKIIGITIIENSLFPDGAAMLTNGTIGVIFHSTNTIKNIHPKKNKSE